MNTQTGNSAVTFQVMVFGSVTINSYQSVSRDPLSAHAVPQITSPIAMGSKTSGTALQPSFNSSPQSSDSFIAPAGHSTSQRIPL